MNPPEGAFVQDVTHQPDPCLTRQPSILRFAVLALLFLTAIPGGVILLILLANRPYGIQFSSIVIDTAAVALYTFSRNRNNMQPFLLSCPVVRRQLPLLIRRHLRFLAALFVVQTTALKLRPNLPAHLTTPSRSDASLFSIILGGLCACLAIVQILSNRALLERAHLSAPAIKKRGFAPTGTESSTLPVAASTAVRTLLSTPVIQTTPSLKTGL
jgi:hypothetical protein